MQKSQVFALVLGSWVAGAGVLGRSARAIDVPGTGAGGGRTEAARRPRAPHPAPYVERLGLAGQGFARRRTRQLQSTSPWLESSQVRNALAAMQHLIAHLCFPPSSLRDMATQELAGIFEPGRRTHARDELRRYSRDKLHLGLVYGDELQPGELTSSEDGRLSSVAWSSRLYRSGQHAMVDVHDPSHFTSLLDPTVLQLTLDHARMGLRRHELRVPEHIATQIGLAAANFRFATHETYTGAGLSLHGDIAETVASALVQLVLASGGRPGEAAQRELVSALFNHLDYRLRASARRGGGPLPQALPRVEEFVGQDAERQRDFAELVSLQRQLGHAPEPFEHGKRLASVVQAAAQQVLHGVDPRRIVDDWHAIADHAADVHASVADQIGGSGVLQPAFDPATRKNYWSRGLRFLGAYMDWVETVEHPAPERPTSLANAYQPSY